MFTFIRNSVPTAGNIKLMTVSEISLQNQKSAIEEMKQRDAPVINMLGGNKITALPNVYAGWLDSELM